MAAPVATNRLNPDGVMLADGYQTLVTFSLDPDVALWEKEVTPYGVEADDLQDVATQHTVRYRGKSPRRLVTLTPTSFTCNYDPKCITSILAMVGINQTITIEYPDHSTDAFYGVIKSFQRGGLSDGNVPEATVTIEATNLDPTTCAEQGPVFVQGGGTGAC